MPKAEEKLRIDDEHPQRNKNLCGVCKTRTGWEKIKHRSETEILGIKNMRVDFLKTHSGRIRSQS